MWKIHKTLEFCYGHRTYTQKLNGEFSSDLKQACRHYHGHEGKLVVHLEGETLDNTGMVTDFRHLEWAKQFINNYIDHQFVMDINDPMFEMFVMAPYNKLTGSTYTNKYNLLEDQGVALVVPNTEHVVGYKLDVSTIQDTTTPEYEVVEGFTIVDFVPTSENLSKWAAEFIQAKMDRLNVIVAQVDWWETPKSCSTYIPPRNGN